MTLGQKSEKDWKGTGKEWGWISSKHIICTYEIPIPFPTNVILQVHEKTALWFS